MTVSSNSTSVVTPEHHDTALIGLSVLHDQPTVAGQHEWD
jgi:hypothetical protein